jgi:hypothetical protein
MSLSRGSFHFSQINFDFFIASQIIGQTRANINKPHRGSFVNLVMAGHLNPKNIKLINGKNAAISHGELPIVEVT